MDLDDISSSTAHPPPFSTQDVLCEVLLFFLKYALNTFCESKCHVVCYGLQRLAFCCFICCPVFWNQTFHKQNFKEQVYKILSHYFLYTTRVFRGTQWRSWVRYCATSRKFMGWIPDGVIGVFHCIVLLAAPWPWGWLSLKQKLVPRLVPEG